jgi:hypothetical protein
MTASDAAACTAERKEAGPSGALAETEAAAWAQDALAVIITG